MLLELAETVHRQHLWTIELSFFSLAILPRRSFTHPCAPRTSVEVKKLERPAVATTTAPAQGLVSYIWTVIIFTDGKIVRYDGLVWALSVLEFEFNAFVLARPARAQLPETAPAIPCTPEALREALGQEREHVEHRRLPTAVRPDKHRQRRDVAQLKISQSTEVAHPELLDARDALVVVHLVAHSAPSQSLIRRTPSFYRKPFALTTMCEAGKHDLCGE
jgi:hypothetical protein